MNKKSLLNRILAKLRWPVFLKYGLEKTTLEDIARSAGMTKSSLFYYYRNKEALFLEVAVKEGEEYLESLQQKQ